MSCRFRHLVFGENPNNDKEVEGVKDGLRETPTCEGTDKLLAALSEYPEEVVMSPTLPSSSMRCFFSRKALRRASLAAMASAMAQAERWFINILTWACGNESERVSEFVGFGFYDIQNDCLSFFLGLWLIVVLVGLSLPQPCAT